MPRTLDEVREMFARPRAAESEPASYEAKKLKKWCIKTTARIGKVSFEPVSLASVYALLAAIPLGGRFVIDGVLRFGKHAGEKFSAVCQTDPSYLRWLSNPENEFAIPIRMLAKAWLELSSAYAKHARYSVKEFGDSERLKSLYGPAFELFSQVIES